GIGWTCYGKKDVGPLGKLNVTQAQIDSDKQYSKGFSDMEANLDTTEARELKKKFSELPKDQVKPFFEGLSLYLEYAHGTYVAGIAIAGPGGQDSGDTKRISLRNDSAAAQPGVGGGLG